MSTSAALSSHVNSDSVTREQLRALPQIIPPSETFKPVPHIELVETISNELAKRKIEIIEEKLALRRDGAMIFGVMKVTGSSLTTNDGSAALGFRAANNKEMSVQMVAGMSVFVCDNLVFRGDMIVLRRKHTSGLVIGQEVNGAIEKVLGAYGTLTGEIDSLKTRQLTDTDAKALIYDVFAQRLMPVIYMPQVGDAYFNPPHQEFEPRTAWSLHNAFTEVANKQPLTSRMDTTQEIGRFFGMVGKQ